MTPYTAADFPHSPMLGVLFVGHTGEIYPSGFLPIRCGKFPADSLVDVYQNSNTFRMLRDMDQLHGKCGACEFRHVCGGSRARAHALSGDMMAEEPDCAYEPARVRLRPKVEPAMIA